MYSDDSLDPARAGSRAARAVVGGGTTTAGATDSTECDEGNLVSGNCDQTVGASNYHNRTLTYSDGIFSGSITTNGCPAKTGDGRVAKPTCVQQARNLQASCNSSA